MTVLGKLGSIIIHAIIPKRFREGFDYKVKKTYDAFHSTLELKIFWRVLFFPIKLPLSMLAALFKTLLAWVLSKKRYGELGYLINELYNDIVLRKTGISLALKRNSLRNELFVKGAEKKVSYGKKNPDKTFYVIRPYYFLETNELCTTIANLLYHYYRVLQSIAYAQNNNWIPVIDWENYGRMPHMEEYPVNGTANGWEYFWKQPSDYTLEEVFQSQNVILSSRNSNSYQYIPPVAIYSPFAKYANRLASLCPQYDRCIKFNEKTETYIQSWLSELFSEGERILGVSVRGVAYGVKRIPGHPVQPTSLELIKEIKEKTDEWEIDKVYFTCEAEWLVNEMKEAFGEQLIILPRQRYEKAPTAEDNPLYEEGRRYQTNLDYLTEMYLLSKCTCLIAGMSSGVRNAVIWNAGEYEHVKIFENEMWK